MPSTPERYTASTSYETRLETPTDRDDCAGLTTDQLQGRIVAACATITAVWHTLVITTVKARTTGTIGRTDTRPAPVSEYVLDLHRRTAETLASWALLIADKRGLWPHLDATDGAVLAAWVSNHHDWLARHEAGADAATELSVKARLLQAAATAHRAEETFFVGPCPGCGQRLHAPRETTALACPACGEVSDRQQVRELAIAHARDVVATPAQIAEISADLGGRPITAAMVRKWAHVDPTHPHRNPNRVVHVDTIPDPTGGLIKRYRVGDVWDRHDYDPLLTRVHAMARLRDAILA